MTVDRTRLVPADGSRIGLLETLLALFLHDLSGHLPPGALRLDDAGRWDWGLDAAAWVLSDGRQAYFVQHGDAIVGMVLLSGDLHLRAGPGRSVDAYFILAPYRRRGLGSAVWSELHALWDGYWEFSTLEGNAAGEAFAREGARRFRGSAHGEQVVVERGRRLRVQWILPRPSGRRREGCEDGQGQGQVIQEDV